MCLVAAAVALSAANPKEGASKPTDNTNQQVAAALDNVAAALKKPPETSNHDKPCAAGQNDRSSDLCAQWKAADAAKYAADVAFWIGVVGSLLGAFTLAVAVKAALYARDAARHTERGANADEKALVTTRDVAAAELRPWVVIRPILTKFAADERGISIDYAVIFQNIGKTAARDLWLRFHAKMIDDKPVEEIEEIWRGWRDLEPEFNRTLLPGEEHVGNGSSNQNAMFIPWKDWGEGKPRRTMLVLAVAAKYLSDMDKEWHWIERSFTVGDNLGEGFMDHQYIPESLRGTWERPSLDVNVVVSEFWAGETS